jgi:iron complex transport system ATP-binding protein
LSQLSLQQRAQRIAYLPQEAPLAPLWTVREVIEQGLSPHRRDPQRFASAREELAWVVERLNLHLLLDKRTQQLSGGERRKVLIARALSQHTPVILLDEPLAGLDWHTQESLMQLLAEVSARRAALVIISLHELNLAWLYAQETLLLSRGQVISAGETHLALNSEQITKAFGISPLLMTHPHCDINQHLPQAPQRS